MDDINWKEEYKGWKSLTPSQIKLLDEGPVSLSQSWLFNAMWSDWKDTKKQKETELPRVDSTSTPIFKDPWQEQ